MGDSVNQLMAKMVENLYVYLNTYMYMSTCTIPFMIVTLKAFYIHRCEIKKKYIACLTVNARRDTYMSIYSPSPSLLSSSSATSHSHKEKVYLQTGLEDIPSTHYVAIYKTIHVYV